jgi:predicted Zn-dependent protease
VQIGKKVIPNEDEYIIRALLSEDAGDYNTSIDIYDFLYKKTQKRVYLEKIAEDLYRSKKYDKVISLSHKVCEEKCDKEILKYEVFSLLQQKKYDKAKEVLLKKLNEKDEFFYSMMSYILIKEGKLNEALYYLKSLYALKPNKNILLDLVDIMIRLKKYNEALAYLRTHLNLYGCDYDVCVRLANIYKSLYDYDNLANIYEKLGQFDERYYILALNIYMQNKKYKKAEELIKKYGLNKEYLMILYAQMKKFRKAAFVALDLYGKTGDLKYLLKYCEFLYNDHPTKEEIEDIIKKLKYISTFYKNAYIYNFLGYLEINYDINVKEGLKYVQKALILDPQNEEYMDSLAWGLYKLHKCEDAYEVIKNVHIDDTEINYHKKMIKRCLNDTGKNNKQNKRRTSKKKK